MKHTLSFLRLAAITVCLGLAACTSSNSRVAPSSNPTTRPSNMGPTGDTPWQQGAQRMAAPSQAWNTTNYSPPTSDNKPISPVPGGPILPSDDTGPRLPSPSSATGQNPY